MREKVFAWTAVIATLLASLAIANPAFAPPPTTVYISPVMSTGAVGDTISVDIMIADVEYLYGYEFRLLYDTNTLTAFDMTPHAGTNNEAGLFFTNLVPPGYSIWKLEINDDMGYVWLAVTRPSAQIGPVSGSGKLATVTFSVDATGAGYFSFDLLILGDPLGTAIVHEIFLGYFSNVAPTTFEANLVGKSAWPEHHHFGAAKDEDGLQTLYGKIRNTGTVPTFAKVNFSLYDESGFLVAEVSTPTTLMAPGATLNLEVAWGGYTVPMKYSVEAQAWYDAVGDGHTQTAGTKIKPFTFAVV